MGFSKASNSQENPDFSPTLRLTVDNKTLKDPLKGRRDTVDNKTIKDPLKGLLTFNRTFSRGLQTLQYVNPRPFSVFRHLRQWRGGGGLVRPPPLAIGP